MDTKVEDEGHDIGQPEGIVEGGYVLHGFSPELIGTDAPEPKAFTRRWLLRKTARVGGGALAIGLAVKLGLSKQEALAYTCSCGTASFTGQWSCEYNSRGTRTGRVSFYYARRLTTGTAGYCGVACHYWGPWHCDTTYCPAPYCPNY